MATHDWTIESVELMRFDPARCTFPRTGIPLRAERVPLAAIASLLRRNDRSSNTANFRHYTRGRYAIHEAYRLAGLRPGTTLLAPAYHCITMLDPALSLGADILFYPLHDDLSPDVAGMQRLLHASKNPIRALLATHFFGLARDFTDLKRWCDTHNIVLVEDCSHVLFTEFHQSIGTGIYGKFVAASPYKFFPGADGGLLYAPESDDLAGIKTKPRDLMSELRGAKHLIDRSGSHGAVPFNRSQFDQRMASLAEKTLVLGEELRVPYTQPSRQFNGRDAGFSSLRTSRWSARASSIEDDIQRRRLHFQRLLEAVAALPCCRALYSHVPPDFTPYMFPLYIDFPTPHFYLLKHLGFPIWRWDELAVSDCPVAQDCRLHLLHIPCHQSLSDEQLDWMITALRKVMHLRVNGAR